MVPMMMTISRRRGTVSMGHMSKMMNIMMSMKTTRSMIVEIPRESSQIGKGITLSKRRKNPLSSIISQHHKFLIMHRMKRLTSLAIEEEEVEEHI